MDKENGIASFSHSINILERKNIIITGVKKVDSFDSEEFLIESVMGYIILKGEGLEMLKLDTRDGVVYPLRIKTKDEIEDDSRKILTSCDDDFTNIQMDLVKNLKESEKIIYNHIKLNELNTIEDLQRNYKTIDVNKIVYDLIQLDLIKYKEQHDLDDY